jgi:hypothetical protein
LPLRLSSGTCTPCSPRSRSFARSAGSPDVVRIGGAARPFISAWALSWPAPCSSLGGFIVPALCPAPICRWKSFRTHRENHSGLLRKTVRLAAGITVHLQPGILFAFTPEHFSRSPRNPVHLRPKSAKIMAQPAAVAQRVSKACTSWLPQSSGGNPRRGPSPSPVIDHLLFEESKIVRMSFVCMAE